MHDQLFEVKIKFAIFVDNNYEQEVDIKTPFVIKIRVKLVMWHLGQITSTHLSFSVLLSLTASPLQHKLNSSTRIKSTA